MKSWIVNNFWMKMVSLALAVLTWFYVNSELNKQEVIRSKFYKPPNIEQIENQTSLNKQIYMTEKKRNA